MSDDLSLAGPPTFTLVSPGVGTTHDPQALESPEGIYWIQLAAGRRLQTVEWFEGHHSEEAPMHAQSPVDWETIVPWGARMFSVTSGVSAARVRQFWVGWLSGRRIHMEALDAMRTLTSPLDAGEEPIFPAVMDGSGAASFYTWRSTSNGSSLWRHAFSESAGNPGVVQEVAGRPVVSRAATVPGLRTQHAIIGWVEQTEQVASILGIAIVENGHARVFRSPPFQWTAPFARQRIGVWAAALDRAEVAAVVAGDGVPETYSIARFGVSPEAPHGAHTIEPLHLKPRQLAQAALDYYREMRAPEFHRALLLHDGSLLGPEGDVIETGVPLDSPLPFVTTTHGAWWAIRSPSGAVSWR